MNDSFRGWSGPDAEHADETYSDAAWCESLCFHLSRTYTGTTPARAGDSPALGNLIILRKNSEAGPPGPLPPLEGRHTFWWARIPVLVWGAWTWIHHLQDDQYQGIAKGLNLALHEAGHAILGWFGEFIGILGGSLFQCLCPAIAFAVFWRQRDRFGLAFCFAWLGTNLYDVATYVADARAMELPLVSPFGGDGEITHDWNWLLADLGWLSHDQGIAAFLRLLGTASFLVFLIWGSIEVNRLRKDA